jgi:hypothetical protein
MPFLHVIDFERMLRMKRKLPFALAIAILFSGCAKIVVVNVPKAKEKLQMDGVFYALPKTAIRVGLTVEKVEKRAAPFARFAGIFAPDGTPECEKPECTVEEMKSYRVKPGAALESFGEPDPDHVYMVKFIGRGALDQTVTMEWTETGVATGAKAKVDNRTIDLIVSGVKLAAGIGTRLGISAKRSDDAVSIPCPAADPIKVKTDLWVLPILRTSSVSAMLIENYQTIPCAILTSWDENRDKQLLMDATKAYDNIIALDAKRQKALGDATVMDPTAVLGKLDALIGEKLQALYLGTKTITPWDGVFEVRELEKESAPASTALLRIDMTKGFCRAGELAPGVKPIPAKDLLSDDDCAKATVVKLALGFYPARNTQIFSVVNEKIALDETGERSFRYRIPAQVKAEVCDNARIYGAAVLSVAQLGVVASLPAKRNSKTLEYDLKFIESTGALRSFTLGTSGGLDSKVIDEFSSVGNSILDARKAARDKEEEKQDELIILKRRQEILKLRDEICELQKKYGLTCDVLP